ncbi:hypothetical protein EMIHUDRAFT_229868 [Emiliania huxleyi CCMP1516]|uniref:Phosphatidate cytidylyltransferase n=2 Tax=Emiliania huxleyi TaxID=2903 RepID=A0A0D3KC31_EMIH1|nr:hypothetical protein EMIHUDRAFT_229868 [Emiliania huxleyi CCMP1516]EOD33316.1 hypothetical protein EMIHUDRAFT_229868 [Emiliania huxleyi CCMP1516]|eukprot:XP_005785745.1 hypothetical protein EMIHUDRAFT_229868 [Emiliania huxleyi CCMP1516]
MDTGTDRPPSDGSPASPAAAAHAAADPVPLTLSDIRTSYDNFEVAGFGQVAHHEHLTVVSNIWTCGAIWTVAVCTLLWSFTSAHHIFHNEADWRGAYYGLILFFGIDLCVLVILAICMHSLYRFLGFTPEEIANIHSSREGWTAATASFYGIVAGVLFRASRIRDGRLGRLNLMLVQFVVFGFYPAVGLLIFHSNIMPTPFFMGYCWQPLIWGDTMAEIIGSFFGRFEFEVYGFGDINRKTVEGVVSCYIASFCACFSYTTVHSSEFPSQKFERNMMMVHGFSALVATIAETFAPRATDNGFMLLGVAVVVIYFYPSLL